MTLVDIFESLNELGWSNIFVILLLIILFTNLITEGGKKFLDNLGLETKKSRISREQEERIKRIEDDVNKLKNSANKFNDDRVHDREQSLNIQRNLVNNLAQFSDTLQDIKKDLVEERIERKRWNILNFADELRHSDELEADLERFNNVFKDYDDYERDITAQGLTNGYVDESIKFIRQKYQEKLSN